MLLYITPVLSVNPLQVFFLVAEKRMKRTRKECNRQRKDRMIRQENCLLLRGMVFLNGKKKMREALVLKEM